ncbi:hypothetical protein PLESTF_001984900 [Pleodorina starrii]|nr:hypothetical protein PLESTF_001984900 [Pleodorina starrii]
MENGLYLDGHFFRKKSLLTEISERLADPHGLFVVIDSLMTLLHQGNTKGQELLAKGDPPNTSIVSGAGAITNIPRQVIFIWPAWNAVNEMHPSWKQVTTIKSNCAESGSTTYINMDIGPGRSWTRRH